MVSYIWPIISSSGSKLVYLWMYFAYTCTLCITMFNLFLKSMDTFQCPLRIRADHGTENVAVARWMLNHYGVAWKPFLTGLSVHNQRIERL